MVLELTFQRASVHPIHDAKRLEEGKDLNDALLDFFVKLGQWLIPEGSKAGKPPPVAYLGSHFYDVLRKGGVKDGREGHKNVANWAKRKLGKGGLFGPGVGALAVPVNEALSVMNGYEGIRQDTNEKHWWLALVLNPQAASKASGGGGEDDDLSLLCLDSFVRAETRYEPAIRATKAGGSLEAYDVEVTGLCRVGFNVKVLFQARGDGSSGALAEPRRSRLRAGGREFAITESEMKGRDRGAEGKPGRLEGCLGFRLDRRGAAKTGGEYIWEYGEPGDDYQPPLRLRMGEKATDFQAEVAHFLGGYLVREREVSLGGASAEVGKDQASASTRCDGAICLPGVPQQETSHDCGFFILEMILRALQLTPEALRELATASSVEIAMLPWPSQKQVFRRKAKLRAALDVLLEAARKKGNGDVDALLKADPELAARIRSAMLDGGPSFVGGFDRWAAGDWDLSASPSRSKSRSASKTRSESRNSRSDSYRKRKKSRKRKKARRDTSTESSRSHKRRSTSASPPTAKPATAQPPVAQQQAAAPAAPTSFTMQDLNAGTTGYLRTLCVQRGVLPAGIVERGDLLKALTPLATGPKVVPPLFAPNAPKVVQPPVHVQPPQNKVFTRADLDAMTSKELRALCVQRGRLPSGLVEREDLIQALVAH
mmetsp:Transcript_85621/g.173792  ORF Transcript_85621/g.173792 Transcript_85621/m.173792 type:complete len:656 (+) Transcript_85621:179-2146(+)